MTRGVRFNFTLSRIAGLGAFVSLGLFIGGLFISSFNEDLGELLVLCSPTLPLLPMVLAFHQLHQSRFPSWSQGIRVIGIVGGLSVLIGATLSFLNPLNVSTSVGAFVLCLIGLMGVWLLSNGLLGLRSRTIPRLLAMLSIVVGIAWIIGIGSTVVNMFNSSLVKSVMGLLGVNILALLVGYLIWTVWSGYLFLTRFDNNSV